MSYFRQLWKSAADRRNLNFLLHRRKHVIKRLKIGIFKHFKLLATSIFCALSAELLSKKIHALLSKRRRVLHLQYLEQWSWEAAVNRNNLCFFQDAWKPPLIEITCVIFQDAGKPPLIEITCVFFSQDAGKPPLTEISWKPLALLSCLYNREFPVRS